MNMQVKGQVLDLSDPTARQRARRISDLRNQAAEDRNSEPDDNMPVEAAMSGNELMTAVMRERYAMPTAVVAALRQTGKLLTLKMLRLVASEKFDKLPVSTQLAVFNSIMDRAFGKGDSALAALALQEKMGALTPEKAEGGDAAKQLEDIEARMEFPEMRTRRPAKVAGEGKSEVLTFSPKAS